MNDFCYLISKIIVRYAKKVPRKTKLKILGETVVLKHEQKKWPYRSTVLQKRCFFFTNNMNFSKLWRCKVSLTRLRWYERSDLHTTVHELCNWKVLSFTENIKVGDYRGEWQGSTGGMILTGQDTRIRRKTCPDATMRNTSPTRTSVIPNPCLRNE